MMKRLMLVASMALIAGALMAAPAFASGVKWSATGTGVMGMKGTLTLKKNGGSAITCTLNATGEPKNVESGGSWSAKYLLGPGNNVNNFNWMTKCSNGGTFEYNAWGEGFEGGPGEFRINGFPEFWSPASSPWGGTYIPDGELEYQFVNGSGSSYSYVSFNETLIGYTDSAALITATGKLEIYNKKTLTALTLAKA
ncbi:MAG: hypothetical protein QOF06_1670 [Solirubrobacterales bacterium]|jgi:hypothetical protein|nr:hypothetical protein [Solirubrobacterales bacterium]